MLESESKQQFVGYATSIDQLIRFSKQQSFLDDETQYLPKWKAGDYFGFGHLDRSTQQVVAEIRFQPDMKNEAMVIIHTAQGKRPEELESLGKGIREKFRNREFRQKMLGQVVNLAKSLKLKKVIGKPASESSSYIAGLSDYYEQAGRIDSVFEEFGFSFNDAKSRFELTL